MVDALDLKVQRLVHRWYSTSTVKYFWAGRMLELDRLSLHHLTHWARPWITASKHVLASDQFEPVGVAGMGRESYASHSRPSNQPGRHIRTRKTLYFSARDKGPSNRATGQLGR
jgi:hypothetical protein